MKKQYFTIGLEEQLNMNWILSDASGILQRMVELLPDRIQSHSRRVSTAAVTMAMHVPDHEMPYDLCRSGYCFALTYGTICHELGIFLVRNRVKMRPAATEKLLVDFLPMGLSDNEKLVAVEAARSCYERYDSRGFPDKLAGEDIPLHSSICAIADTMDMMLGDFPSDRQMYSAMEYIRRNKGKLFRPDAVRCFELAKDKLFSIYNVGSVVLS